MDCRNMVNFLMTYAYTAIVEPHEARGRANYHWTGSQVICNDIFDGGETREGMDRVEDTFSKEPRAISDTPVVNYWGCNKEKKIKKS